MATVEERLATLEAGNAEHRRRLDGINGQIVQVHGAIGNVGTDLANFRAQWAEKIGGLATAEQLAGLSVHLATMTSRRQHTLKMASAAGGGFAGALFVILGVLTLVHAI